MTYNFQERLQHLGERMSEINSELVTYYRGDSSTSWNVSIARVSELDPIAQYVSMEVLQRLHKITGYVAELSFDDVLVLPVQNDIIERSSGDRFQVVTPYSAPKCFRYTTVTRDRIEVYAQSIARQQS